MKTNRNVHASGALGRLLSSGQITKVNENESPPPSPEFKGLNRVTNSYFKTSTGIEFKENELLYLDPEECEPWKYANRQDAEMADLQELMNSIQKNQQLQPGLVRPLPTPHGKIKYEIIFGRRRHLACLRLGIPFLVIQKELSDIQDAIVTQDAENKERKDVSNYSNAVLYKKLMDDNVFKTEKELANKLGMSASSLNDIMAFNRIPHGLIVKIPDIHSLSTIMALKIVSLLSQSKDIYGKLLEVAPLIGTIVTSPAKLEAAIKSKSNSKLSSNIITPKAILASNGQKLFTFRTDSKGVPSFLLDKKIKDKIDFEAVCKLLKDYLEKHAV